MHATQDKDYEARAGRAREDMILYRRCALRGHLGYHVVADDLACGVGSMDVLGSSYFGSSYPQLQAAYDICEYRFGAFETSSFSGYYPMQSEASYGSDFTVGIFGWIPP